MKSVNFKLSLSLVALLLLGFSLSAQKLSPDLRMMLDQRTATPERPTISINAAGSNSSVDNETVKVFISIDSDKAIDELSAMDGVEVEGIYDGVVTATVRVDQIDKVAAVKSLRYMQLGSQVNLLNNFGRWDMKVHDVQANTNNQLPRFYRGEGVVIGMIDLGMEYAHPAFYNYDRTELRIRRVWDQNRSGTPPAGFSYGVEYATQAAILNATYDTQQTYHATHTTGTAAGGDLRSKYYGMAPYADIVFVSFDQSSSSAIADAIKYIFNYADEVGKPCVINMSLGSHQGPHDGTSYLDKIIDQLVGPGRIIVGAVGNEGEFRMHASKTFTATNKILKTMLTINENSGHKQHQLDIWGDPGTNLKVNFCMVNSLKGQIASRSSVLNTAEGPDHIYYTAYTDTEGAEFEGAIYSEINPESNRPHVWISSKLSSISDGKMIGLEVTGEEGSTVHMWNVGQNEFSSNGKTGWTNGTADCTAGEIGGTAKRIISVGSYDGRPYIEFVNNGYFPMENFPSYSQYQHSVFSSYGPTADGRLVPHILAPGMPVISSISRYAYTADDLSVYTSEILTDDIGRNFYYAYDMGTSMSAPAVAGTIALMLEAYPDLTPEQAKSIIMSTATTTEDMGTLPNNTYGAGKLNALDCVVKAIGISAIDDVLGDESTESARVWADKAAGTIHVVSANISGKVSVSFYTVSGALVKTVNVAESHSLVDASGWEHGVYVARMSDGTNTKSFKILL